MLAPCPTVRQLRHIIVIGGKLHSTSFGAFRSLPCPSLVFMARRPLHDAALGCAREAVRWLVLASLGASEFVLPSAQGDPRRPPSGPRRDIDLRLRSRAFQRGDGCVEPRRSASRSRRRCDVVLQRRQGNGILRSLRAGYLGKRCTRSQFGDQPSSSLEVVVEVSGYRSS